MKKAAPIPSIPAGRTSRINRTLFLLPALLFCMVAVAGAAANKDADYVFKNGAVYTMDASAPKAEAVAITGKEISYVGDNKGAEALVGQNTQVIDLKGRMLLPGFVESHIHPTFGHRRLRADLPCDSVDEVLARQRPGRTITPPPMPNLSKALAGDIPYSDDRPDQGGFGQAVSR